MASCWQWCQRGLFRALAAGVRENLTESETEKRERTRWRTSQEPWTACGCTDRRIQAVQRERGENPRTVSGGHGENAASVKRKRAGHLENDGRPRETWARGTRYRSRHAREPRSFRGEGRRTRSRTGRKFGPLGENRENSTKIERTAFP